MNRGGTGRGRGRGREEEVEGGSEKGNELAPVKEQGQASEAGPAVWKRPARLPNCSPRRGTLSLYYRVVNTRFTFFFLLSRGVEMYNINIFKIYSHLTVAVYYCLEKYSSQHSRSSR